MKHIALKISSIFCLYFLIFGVTSAENRTVTISVADGVEYIQHQIIHNNLPRNISILKIDFDCENIKINVATATAGREKTSSIANRLNAEAAINGGFFGWDGSHNGLLKQNRQIISPTVSPARGVIGFTTTRQVIIDRVDMQNGKLIGLSGTDWSEVYDALSGGPILIKNGKKQVLWQEEGRGLSFSTTNHPRTAIGVTANNEIIMIVVDGRQPGFAVGMSLDELAEFMLDLGCIAAVNLDGGGSSTMVLDDKIVNSVSDGAKEGRPGNERAVTNAIVLQIKDGS